MHHMMPLPELTPFPTDFVEDLRAIRARHGLPAIGCLVIDGSGMRAAVDGLRRLDADVPARVDDRWHIGSCGKALTARLAQTLVSEGVLRWDTPIGRILPPGVPAAFRDVTLEMLLMHRGGVPSDPRAFGDLWRSLWDVEDHAHGRRAVVDRVLNEAATTSIGTYAYSNFGYVLVGVLCEEAAGVPWEVLLEKKVFEPLGMESSGFGPAGDAAHVADQPWGHAAIDGKLIPRPPGIHADNPRCCAPAGAMHVSLADWGQFLRSCNETTIDLDAASRATYLREAWCVSRRDAGPLLSHAGSNTLNFAMVEVDPKLGVARACVSNASSTLSETALCEVMTKLKSLSPL